MTELWKPVAGYEGVYEVSTLGRVKSLPRVSPTGRKSVAKVKILKGTIGGEGYPVVNLSLKGKVVQRTLHTLVAEAFIGPCPAGQEVRHGDGDRANPNLENLSYGTRRENVADAQTHGTHVQGERVGNSKLKVAQVLAIRRRAAAGESVTLLAAEFGVSHPHIIDIRERRKWAWLAEET